MTSSDEPLPTFVIIGAQKSATRWLRSNLGKHPDVFTADRELAYFNTRRFEELGTEWYRRQFEGWEGQRFVGEATPGYLMLRHDPRVVARRMRRTVPSARLIAVLRNPVDRALSAMRHHIKRGRIPRDADLLDLVRSSPPESERFGLVNGGRYAESLKPYRRRFRRRLLVMLHDDVVADPETSYRLALAHIGVSDTAIPDDLDDIVFSNRTLQTPGGQLTSLDERQELWAYFADDVRRLEKMLRRDLSAWAPSERDS